MNVFVISLSRSHDRRRSISQQLDRLGVPFQFLDATDAKTGEHLTFARFLPNLASRYGTRLTSGEAACFASHARVWELCANSNQPMIVLEDNTVFSPMFPDTIKAAKEELASGTADLIRLGAIIPRCFVPVRQVASGMHLVRYLKGPSGGQAYALSPAGARKLLGSIKHWAEPVDDYLDRFWTHGLPSLALHPLTVRRDDVPTTIPGRVPPKGWPHLTRKIVRNWDAGQRHLYNLNAWVKSVVR